eukprot:1091909-Pleurochrysis_carterae.AAC.2
MQLSQYTVDKLNAEDGTPACHLPEGRVRAARDRGKGDEQRNPRVGYLHRPGGEMRGVAQVGAGFSKGSEGGHYQGWRHGAERVSLGTALGATCHARTWASLPAQSPSTRLMIGDCAKARD